MVPLASVTYAWGRHSVELQHVSLTNVKLCSTQINGLLVDFYQRSGVQYMTASFQICRISLFFFMIVFDAGLPEHFLIYYYHGR